MKDGTRRRNGVERNAPPFGMRIPPMPIARSGKPITDSRASRSRKQRYLPRQTGNRSLPELYGKSSLATKHVHKILLDNILHGVASIALPIRLRADLAKYMKFVIKEYELS